MHIWLGTFGSKKELEKYLDQKKYMEAWAVYDHEPPTGNEVEDAEPGPELRCDFCKEVGLDIYDEDLMVIKFYKIPVDHKTVAQDILVDEKEFDALCEVFKTRSFNSVIAYEDNDLNEKAALGSRTIKYIGKLPATSDEDLSDGSYFHYLWVSESKLDKKNILRQAGIDNGNVVKLNYYYTAKSEKLDEILILQIEDYSVAEKMILKADEMKILAASSILHLLVKGTFKIDGESTADALEMKYIGKFASH